MEILKVSTGLMPRRGGLWEDEHMSVEEAREAVEYEMMGDPYCGDAEVKRLLDDLIREVKAEMCANDHCWVMADYQLMSNPPQSVRSCKHCGHTQVGRPQPAMEWRDR